MSESPTSPFTMVGAEDAAVCIDGVCEVPLGQNLSQAREPSDVKASNRPKPSSNSQA